MYTFYADRNGRTFKRIHKSLARRLYLKGYSILIAACKMSISSRWNIGLVLNRLADDISIDEIGARNRFDDYVASYEYYNCSNETGRYVSYYIPVVMVDGKERYDNEFRD